MAEKTSGSGGMGYRAHLYPALGYQIWHRIANSFEPAVYTMGLEFKDHIKLLYRV